MKLRALTLVCLAFAASASPSLAFERHAPRGLMSERLIQQVVCDPNGDGKQAGCMRDCEEEEIRSRATYGKQTPEERVAEKKACDKKCGC
jgi:hypothetical protein